MLKRNIWLFFVMIVLIATVIATLFFAMVSSNDKTYQKARFVSGGEESAWNEEIRKESICRW